MENNVIKAYEDAIKAYVQAVGTGGSYSIKE